MTITELRIGNWVQCAKSYENRPVRVSGVSVVDRRDDQSGIYEEFLHLNEHDLVGGGDFQTFVDYKHGVIDLQDIEGIPLTAEILRKCGHEKEGIVSSRLSLDCDFGKVMIPLKNPTELCRYLHQYQNLFFALTGIELEVEL